MVVKKDWIVEVAVQGGGTQLGIVAEGRNCTLWLRVGRKLKVLIEE